MLSNCVCSIRSLTLLYRNKKRRPFWDWLWLSVDSQLREKKFLFDHFLAASPELKNHDEVHDVIVLCFSWLTTPRRRNLLVALAHYTVTHCRSSSWLLSSLLMMRELVIPNYPIKVLSKTSHSWSTDLHHKRN